MDYDAQIAELAAYSPGFTDEDISLPEGTYLDDGELVVDDDAPEVVQDVLVDSGFAESEMSRSGVAADDDDDPSVPEAWMIEEQKRQNEEKNQGGDTPEAPAAGNDAGNAGAGNAGGNANAGNGDIAAVQYMQQYNATQKAIEFQDDGWGDNGNGANADNGANAGNGGGNNAAAGSGGEDQGSGNATLDYLTEYNDRQKRFKNYDAIADYTVETLSYINPTAGKVAQFGSDAYNIFKGVYNGDVGSVLKGGMGVLKMFGLFKKKGSTAANPGVSNEQILSEVQKVGLEVVDLHELTSAMNDSVNIIKQEIYSNGVEAYDNAIIALTRTPRFCRTCTPKAQYLRQSRALCLPTRTALPTRSSSTTTS